VRWRGLSEAPGEADTRWRQGIQPPCEGMFCIIARTRCCYNHLSLFM